MPKTSEYFDGPSWLGKLKNKLPRIQRDSNVDYINCLSLSQQKRSLSIIPIQDHPSSLLTCHSK